MKKFTKAIGVMLVVAMLATVLAVASFAAAPASIKIVKAPDRTVCYEKYDTYEGDVYCEPTGMILEVTNDDGSKENVECDMFNTEIIAENYELGKNEAVVYYYYDENNPTATLETKIEITVEENPVESVEITKMPAKTEYDWDKEVLTRNSTFDDYATMFPEILDEILAEEEDMTIEDLRDFYEANPDKWQEVISAFLAEDEGLLIPDLTGMEITVKYTDGTSEVLTPDDDYNTYDGYKFPVFVDAENAGFVEPGENKYFVYVMGTETPFTLTVKKAAPVVPDEKPPVETPKEDPKNPDIPNTDGTTVAAVAVIAVMSACGVALIPSKKER